MSIAPFAYKISEKRERSKWRMTQPAESDRMTLTTRLCTTTDKTIDDGVIRITVIDCSFLLIFWRSDRAMVACLPATKTVKIRKEFIDGIRYAGNMQIFSFRWLDTPRCLAAFDEYKYLNRAHYSKNFNYSIWPHRCRRCQHQLERQMRLFSIFHRIEFAETRMFCDIVPKVAINAALELHAPTQANSIRKPWQLHRRIPNGIACMT